MSLPGYDAWKLASPPEYDAPDLCSECGREWEGDAGQCKSCGYGEPSYECDSCRRMVPVSEIRSVRNTSAGQGEFCERCLGMDAATSRDAAGIRHD